MKTLVIIAFILSILATCYAASARGDYKDPNHPGKCAIKADLILSPGEHKDPNQDCGRIICNDDSTAEFHTCGVAGAPPGCEFGDYKDKTLNYPECCDKHLICDGKKN